MQNKIDKPFTAFWANCKGGNEMIWLNRLSKCQNCVPKLVSGLDTDHKGTRGNSRGISPLRKR